MISSDNIVPSQNYNIHSSLSKLDHISQLPFGHHCRNMFKFLLLLVLVTLVQTEECRQKP